MSLINDAKISIIRSNRKTLSIQVKSGEIIVRSPLILNDKEIYFFIDAKKVWIEKQLFVLSEQQKNLGEIRPLTKKELQDLYKKAKEIITERVEYYAPEIGVAYNRITIRCQKTRWGSCSAKGNLSFNCLLALLPEKVIDSVVIHELCHIKQMNHSKKFYEEIKAVFPDYKKYHSWLSKNGGKYLSRIPK